MDQPTTVLHLEPIYLDEADGEKVYYFTFGARHTDPHNPPRIVDGENTGGPVSLGTRYVEIFGSYEKTRELMVAHFGNGWAFQYGDRENPGIVRFNLTRYVPDWIKP